MTEGVGVRKEEGPIPRTFCEIPGFRWTETMDSGAITLTKGEGRRQNAGSMTRDILRRTMTTGLGMMPMGGFLILMQDLHDELTWNGLREEMQRDKQIVVNHCGRVWITWKH